jgi:hypothetical protein
MKDYVVTVDTLREQYIYDVEAKCEHDAENEAIQRACADGMGMFATTYVTVERA